MSFTGNAADATYVISGNLIHGKHEFSVTYDNVCQTIGAPLVFTCNSPPQVNPTVLNYNLYKGEELDLDFASLFSEPIDIDPEDLLYTKDTSTWPSWLAFYPERG